MPDDPTQDPMLRLRYYRDTKQDDMARLYEQYLRDTGQYRTELSTHGERLTRKIKRQAQNEAEQVNVGGEVGRQLAGGLSAGLGMLPGGQRLMAGIGSATSNLSYDEALNELENAQADAPMVLKRASQAAGLIGSMGAVPLRVLQGGRAAGAVFGGGMAGAQRFAEAKPESLGSRVSNTIGSAGIGAGMGYAAPWMMANPIARTTLGAVGGALLGNAVAPEGTGPSGALTGAAVGGAAMASPSTTARLASKATQRIAPKLSEMMESLAQATGLKGVVNRELRGTQDVLDATRTGAIVGGRGGGARTLNTTKAAQTAAGNANYGRALSEGEQAWNQYQQGRADMIDENVRRMLNQIQQDVDQSTVQSATGASAKGQSVRDAIESLRQKSAEAARRRGPTGSTNPFAGQSPRPQNIVQQQRGAMFDREAMGVRPSELGTTAGAGEPQFVDTQRLSTETGRGATTPMPAPYRPETTQAGIDEMRSQSAGIGDRFSVTTPHSTEPTLEFPDRTLTVVRRGAAEPLRIQQAGPRLNETPAQTAAREALERTQAYQSLPASVKEAPIEGQLPVPHEVHPAVTPMYQNDVVARAAGEVRTLAQFRNLPPDDPRFIDEVYKVISDQKLKIGKTVEGAAGSVNFLRATKQGMQDAQDLILRTTDDLMPTYRKAVDTHAAYAAQMKAFTRFYDAVKGGVSSGKALATKSSEALETWLAQQKDPRVVEAARQGARFAHADAVASAPLNKGRAGVLALRPFRQSAEDQARRSLTDLPDLQRVVSNTRQTAAEQKALNVRMWFPGAEGHVAGTLINSLFKPPLERAAATKIFEEVLQNPQAYQQILAKYSTGKAMTAKLSQLFATQFGALPAKGQ